MTEAVVLAEQNIDGTYEVPPCVEHRPTLVLHYLIYPPETPPDVAERKARARFEDAPPLLLRGEPDEVLKLLQKLVGRSYCELEEH